MRHGKKFNHLSRTSSHRKAMLSNMASSLILKKRIKTTVAKAKALRKYVEPLLTKAKSDTTHSRRIVFSYLQNKYSVQELFGEVASRIAERPGGYTRILKTGNRLGDNADMCIIELVDYNEILLTTDKSAKSKTRRGRSKKKSDDSVAESAPVAASKASEKASEAAVEDAVVESSTEEVEAEAQESPEASSEEQTEKSAEEKADDAAEEEKNKDN